MTVFLIEFMVKRNNEMHYRGSRFHGRSFSVNMLSLQNYVLRNPRFFMPEPRRRGRIDLPFVILHNSVHVSATPIAFQVMV